MTASAWMVLSVGVLALPVSADEAGAPLAVARLPRIATVDGRYQSYNLAEVIGGQDATTVDLSRPRLRKLALALGPAYVRVSGALANPREWKGVVDFARAADAKIVASFAVSAGVRDASGAWTPGQARKLLAYTKSLGSPIAAAEVFAEPIRPSAGGAPQGYDAKAFARDVAVFRRFAKQAAPRMLIVGPGSAGDGAATVPASLLPGEALLSARPKPIFDVFSYRYSGAASLRCARTRQEVLTSADEAMSEGWLSRIDKVHSFYVALRDKFEPRKPIWLTETVDAACGGNPWAAAFLDTFRYVDQLGRMARRGLEVHIHNALASGDWGLIDEKTLTPRPNYWAALLWRRLMGTTVLDAGASHEGLHLYAHCLRGHRGGVALLAINNTRNQPQQLELPVGAERYTLSARRLRESRVDLNGNQLTLQANDELPDIRGVPTLPGPVVFVPASITFVAIANAGNAACR